jgi:hypothetical protein
MKLEFSRQIFEKYSVSDYINICPLEAELFVAGGRMEIHDKANGCSSEYFWRV